MLDMLEAECDSGADAYKLYNRLYPLYNDIVYDEYVDEDIQAQFLELLTRLEYEIEDMEAAEFYQ